MSSGLSLSPRRIATEVIATIQHPRKAAQRLLALNLPTSVLWEALLLVVTLSVLLGHVIFLLSGGEAADDMPLLANPFVLGGVQFVLLALATTAVHSIGRLMGGTGSFAGALVLVTWLQVVMVCLQLLQTAAFLLMPPLAVLLGYAGVVLFLWLLTNFVAVLHGFASLGMVFVMLLLSAFGVIFVLSMLLTMLGLVPNGGFDV